MAKLIFLCAFLALGWALDAPLLKLSKSYYVSTVQEQYLNALATCKSNGLSLVTLRTREDDYNLNQTLYDNNVNKRLWVGGFYEREDTTHGSWIWLEDGISFSYTNWANGQPSTTGNLNYCAEKSTNGTDSGKWWSKDCTLLRYFVCELS